MPVAKHARHPRGKTHKSQRLDLLEPRRHFAVSYTITALTGTTQTTLDPLTVGVSFVNNTYQLLNDPLAGAYVNLIKGKTTTKLLPPTGKTQAYGEQTSETGTVVGFSGLEAFKWVGGKISDLGQGRANAISPDGKIIVGQRGVKNSSGVTLDHGWVFGTNKDLGTTQTGNSSRAFDVNNAGTIVGEAIYGPSFFPAFTTGAGWTQIGTTPGKARAVNASGLAVGTLDFGFGNYKAFSYNTKTAALITLNPATVSGGTGQYGWGALDVNSAGDIVGYTDAASSKFITFKQRATIWQGGTTPVDLNTLIPASAGVTLVYAKTINDKGQILCEGYPKNATATSPANIAYLLSPNQGTLASNGTLSITGTSADDVVSVALKGSKISVSVNGAGQTFSKSSIKRIAIDVLGGNDTVTLGTGIRAANIKGGSGNDTFNVRNSIKDIVDGGSGKDKAQKDASDSVTVETLIP